MNRRQSPTSPLAGASPRQAMADDLGVPAAEGARARKGVEQVACRRRAFREQMVVSGPDPNRFTYVGKNGYYRQPDPANYWLRARVCEDGSGRFVSRDRAQDGGERVSLRQKRAAGAGGPIWQADQGGSETVSGSVQGGR